MQTGGAELNPAMLSQLYDEDLIYCFILGGLAWYAPDLEKAMASLEDESDVARSDAFPSTHWSIVVASVNPSSVEAENALQTLCRAYWYPLYSYVRRRGYAVHDAQDLTQEFFAQLIEKHRLKHARPDRGKFRSFLLSSLKNFLNAEWRRSRATKRGGAYCIIPWEESKAEERYSSEPAAEHTPEKSFERGWALTLLERAFSLLRNECIASGKSRQFEHLQIFLSTEIAKGDYADAGQKLQMSVGSVAVAVHRMRQRYRSLVSAEIAETVSTAEERDEEMRSLF